MGITAERRQFIADIANDEWIGRIDRSMPDSEFDVLSDEWQRRTDEFLRDTTDSAELHLFVKLWNWDGGIEEIRKVINHPHCEAATALMVYWRMQPEFYSRLKASHKMTESEQENFELLKQVELRFVSGDFPVGDCHYDPADDNDRLATIRSTPIHDWIPRRMFESVPNAANVE